MADGGSPDLKPGGYRKIRAKTVKNGKNRQELVNLPDMALPPALLVRKGRINLRQIHLIFELDYRETREHTSSGRNKNDEEKFMPNTRLEAPVQIYGSDFLARI